MRRESARLLTQLPSASLALDASIVAILKNATSKAIPVWNERTAPSTEKFKHWLA